MLNVFRKKKNEEDYNTYNDDVTEDVVKDRLEKKRELDLKSDLEKVESLGNDYTKEQKESMVYAINKGIPFSTVKELIAEPLKLYALADAYELYPNQNILDELLGLNFMQIRWAIIPMMKREMEVLEESKEDQNQLLDKPKIQPIADNVISSQLSILQYMYESLMTGESYVFDVMRKIKGKQVRDVSERFIISYSGKMNQSGYLLKRVIFSHGYYNEIKPLFVFTIDNHKNIFGSFKMYSTAEEKNRDLDLNLEEFNLIYDSINTSSVRKNLDEEIESKQREGQMSAQKTAYRR